MASNNNEMNGAAMGIALVMMAAIFLAIFVYIALAAFTAFLSIISLCALWKPFKLGKNIITPKEARWFLMRGIIGAYVLPYLVIVFAPTLNIEFQDEWLIHLMVVGYIAGSLGGEYVRLQLEKLKQNDEPEAPPVVVNPPAPNLPKVTYQGKPFEYASWDDEEDRS